MARPLTAGATDHGRARDTTLGGLLGAAATFLDADLLVAFAWRDARTATVRAAHPPLPDGAPTILTLDRAAVAAAGGAVLETATPRRLVSSALHGVLPARPTAAWVVAATPDCGSARDDHEPAGGLLAVWCGGAPDPALVDARRLGPLRAALARAFTVDALAADDIALRFDAIMAAVPQAVVFVDDEAEAGLVNAAAAALLDVSAGPVAPGDLAARMAALRTTAANAPEIAARAATLWGDAAARVDGPDGWLWRYDAPVSRTLRVATRPVTRDGSRGRLWTFDDVTHEAAVADALRTAEAEAAASARELRALFAAMRDVVLVLDRDGRYLRAVPTAADVRLPLDAFLGRRVHDVLAPAMADAVLATIRRALDTGRAAEVEYALDVPAGRVWIAATGSPLGDGTVLWVARDVTARREADADRARLQAVIGTTPDIVSLATPDGRVVYANQAVRRLLGVPDDAPLTMQDFAAARPPAVSARLRDEAFPAVHRDGYWQGESALVAADGRVVPVTQIIQAHYDADGAVEFLSTVMRDATQQKQAEAALRASEGRFRAAMDASPDACFLLETVRDADGRVADFTYAEVNARGGAMYGLPHDDMVGHTMCALFPIMRGNLLFAHLTGVAETGVPYEGEYQTRDPRSTASWLWLQVVPLRRGGDGANGPVIGIAITAHDITARKRVEGERRLLHEVTAAIGAAADVAGALGAALRAMCAATAMEYGEAWLPAAAAEPEAIPGTLERGPAWYDAADARLAAFDAASRASTFAPGAGLPGRAAATGAPVWVPDVGAPEAALPRASLARRAGLRTGLAVPVLADGAVIAVLSFHARQVTGAGPGELGVLAAVGAQVGAVVRQKLAEAALREREAELRLTQDAGGLRGWVLDFATDRLRLTAGTRHVIALPCPAGGAAGNDTCHSPTGRADEVIGAAARALIHPDDVRQADADLAAALADPAGRYASTYRAPGPDGALRWVRATGEVERAADGTPRQLRGVSVDVTPEVELRRRAEASEADLRALFAAMRDVVLVYDGDGTYLRVLPTAPERPFTPLADLVGRRVHDVLPPDVADCILATVRRVAATGTVQRLDYILPTPDGPQHMVGTGSRLGPNAVLWVARDVTAERVTAAALEREREFLAAVLESLAEGVVACDADGRLTLFNRAAREFYDLAESRNLPRKRWVEHCNLFHADGTTPLAPDDIPLVRALRGEVVRGAEMVIAAAGTPRTLVAGGQPVTGTDGRSLGAVVAMRDITARVEAERRKSEFVTTVSHELRTPLTSISGSLGLLAMGVAGALPPKAGSLVSIAKANTERLIRLVTDVLDLDKIEAGKMEYAMTALDPADLVRAAADGIAGMAATAGLEVVAQVEGHAAVLGDRDRLLQVLTNLLSNALKFSPPHSAVVLRAAPHTDAGGPDVVRFAVEDYGPGIPPDKLALLFQKFRQLGVTESTRRGGTGLGLAITKAIVEQHGGRVGVASEPGRRTVFWCDLPVHAPAVRD